MASKKSSSAPSAYGISTRRRCHAVRGRVERVQQLHAMRRPLVAEWHSVVTTFAAKKMVAEDVSIPAVSGLPRRSRQRGEADSPSRSGRPTPSPRTRSSLSDSWCENEMFGVLGTAVDAPKLGVVRGLENDGAPAMIVVSKISGAIVSIQREGAEGAAALLEADGMEVIKQQH